MTGATPNLLGASLPGWNAQGVGREARSVASKIQNTSQQKHFQIQNLSLKPSKDLPTKSLDKMQHMAHHAVKGETPLERGSARRGDGPPAYVHLTCDGGADESPSKISFMFLLGRLWRDFDLDLLICDTFAAGDSRRNKVERSSRNPRRKRRRKWF